MLSFVVRRIVFSAAVLLGTSIITFTIAFLIPADPAVVMAGAKADPQTLATIRHELGLDQPRYVQYGRIRPRACTETRALLHPARRGNPPDCRFRHCRACVSAMAVSLAIASRWGRLPHIAARPWTPFYSSCRWPWFRCRVLAGTMLLVAGIYLHSFPLGGYAGPVSLVLPTLTLRSDRRPYIARSAPIAAAWIRTMCGRPAAGPVAQPRDAEACDGKCGCR